MQVVMEKKIGNLGDKNFNCVCDKVNKRFF